MSEPTALPAIEELLPHRDTMLLLDRVTGFKDATTTAEYTPRRSAWYADARGHMPAWIGIELMAQTVAAHVGLTKRLVGEPPKMGALLGTRSYRSAVPHFKVNETLLICATMVYRDASGLGAYDCAIAGQDTELATATLKVFEPEDFQSFMNGSLP